MYCFSVLLNSTLIETFLINLKRCALIFGSEYVNNEVQCAINELEDTFKKLGEVPQLIDSNTNNINEELAEDILEITTNSEEAMILSSCQKPFFASLKQTLSSLNIVLTKHVLQTQFFNLNRSKQWNRNGCRWFLFGQIY